MFLSNGAAVPSQIDTLGDSTPIFADASYYSRSSMPLSGMFAAYGALYRKQLWVATAVRKLAFGTARMPLDVKRHGQGTDQVPETGGLADLLRHPNEHLDPLRLWLWTSSTYDVYGEAFWFKARDKSGRVRELHPMHPTNVIVRRDPDTGELFYIYSSGVRNVSLLPPIPAADVVPFMGYNPDDLVRGMSVLEPLRDTLLNEDAARRATASWWQRGARPSVALKHPGSLSEPAQERLRKTWDSQHAGADLMGGTAILEEGMEAQIVQLNAEEMQYIETRKLNREEVCAAYDVPPPVLHILDHATYSNITEQLRSMYRDTMAPRFTLFEAALDHHLVPDFDKSGEVFTRFNMDDVLRGDFEVRATSVATLISNGVLMPSEGRPMFGLSEAGDEGKQLYGNAALVPLGSSIRGTQEVDASGDLIPNPIPGTSAGTGVPPSKSVTVRGLLGAAGRARAGGKNVRAALVAEHESALTDIFTRQAASLKGSITSKSVDLSEWDGELSDTLHTLGTATSKALGDQVAKQLGGTYDPSDLDDWLESDCEDTAAALNTKTAGDFGAVADGEDPSSLLEGFTAALLARAAQVATTRVTSVGGLAELSSARQSSAVSKTWEAGSNARASHAAMDGETVPMGETFSNGMDGPGDPAGGADEVAGCNCELSFERGDA